MCEHGFIGACAECDGCGQSPEEEYAPDCYADLPAFHENECDVCGRVGVKALRCQFQFACSCWRGEPCVGPGPFGTQERQDERTQP